MYKFPSKYFYRLHHVRPRFKNDIENVLLFMAAEIELIGEKEEKEFQNKLQEAIKRYPGNSSRKEKTISNWRTEISSLLALVQYSKDGKCRPSKMAKNINSNENLIEFFRYFCFNFQYPGGYLKEHEIVNYIKKGIKFKPVHYIIKVLIYGQEKEEKFGITKAEATHCIFNDLRVTRDQRNVNETYLLIKKNRLIKNNYTEDGDIIRYAGDILDYMVLANLLRLSPNGKYFLVTSEIDVIQTFQKDKKTFTNYDIFYQKSDLKPQDLSGLKNSWYDYFNENLNKKIFETTDNFLFKKDDEKIPKISQPLIQNILQGLEEKKISNKIKTKDIGNAGEAVTMHHEVKRLQSLGKIDLSKQVKKIPDYLGVGYDIKSFEGQNIDPDKELQRLIEVKSTISKNKVNSKGFNMTVNEWTAAETLKEAYYIYRLQFSNSGAQLFIIKDPVTQYKKDKISMRPGANIVRIEYTNDNGIFEEILQ